METLIFIILFLVILVVAYFYVTDTIQHLQHSVRITIRMLMVVSFVILILLCVIIVLLK